MVKFRMRLPTDSDYARLCDATKGLDEKMRWKSVITIVETPDGFAGCGYHAPRWCQAVTNTFQRKNDVFFRPAFDCLAPKELPEDLTLGDVIIIGTLFVNGTPVRIPQEYSRRAVCERNAFDTIKSLELRPPINEPDYAIWGVYIGDNVFAADRPVIRRIAPSEIKTILQNERSAS